MKPQVSLEDFAREFLTAQGITELEIFLSVCWYVALAESSDSVSFSSVVDIIEKIGIRHGINRTRLSSNVAKSRLAAVKNDTVKLTLAHRKNLEAKYGTILSPKLAVIGDTVLQLSDFAQSRSYTGAIANQVNGARQFQLFDACAVMMRRLAEVLIIDAYESKGLRNKITDKGNYMMFSGLIGALSSGADFRLSRNAPRWLERLKELGDNAAHSRTYITKQLDIDDFKGSFRNLVSELASL